MTEFEHGVMVDFVLALVMAFTLGLVVCLALVLT